jgi:hypothetical protein
MNSDYGVRIITGHNDPNPIAFHLAKVAPVSSVFTLRLNRISHYKFRVRLT